jgi:hypothetical protein
MVQSTSLRSGNTTSCGCYRAEMSAKSEKRKSKVKYSKKPEYSAWVAMKQRCLNPNDKRYKDYGGRGISICEKWMSFMPFYQDLGDRPSKLHSIDRIDNNGNYTPENCRWVTRKTNANNRRTSNIWTVQGMDFKNLREASCYFGVSTKAISNWCNGHYSRGKFYQPKQNCKVRKLYENL